MKIAFLRIGGKIERKSFDIDERQFSGALHAQYFIYGERFETNLSENSRNWETFMTQILGKAENPRWKNIK